MNMEISKAEAKIRLDLALRLLGRGSDLPLPLYNELVEYRETLKAYIQGELGEEG
jgi:hypothetical protein